MKKATGFFKRLAALTLAGAMVGGALTGCGSSQSSQATENEENTSVQATESAAEESKAPADEGEPVELVWYVAGYGPQADLDSVLAEANAYLKEKLNCTLKIVESDFGSYDQKMQMVIASQEEYDLCFTANWSNDFYNNVNKNAFLELDDLVSEYAPELSETMPESGWEAAKVNGKLYAVPNMQIWARANAVILDKEVVEKYNFDTSTVSSLKDLEPLMAAVKADNPNMYPFAADVQGILDFLTMNMGYDELAGRHIPGVVMFDDEELKVVNQFELPQVQEHYQLMYEWAQKGYIRLDAATITDSLPEVKAGNHIARLTGTVKPGLEAIEKENFGGRDVEIVSLSDPWLCTSGITATMTAISRTSKNPEKAMQFINLFNTDAYLYNLITQGIEGKHYETLEDGYIAPIDNSGYFPNADWMYGNQFLAYLKEGQDADVWDQTIELNTSAKNSVALGFAFDPSNVQNEIASVNAVVKEFELSLDTGAVDPATTMPQFLDKLEQAGSQTIIDEVQRQLDEWKATK